MTNCPNCGAVVELNADRCTYCGTPYTKKETTPTADPEHYAGLLVEIKNDHRALLASILTLNEHRRLHGLPEIRRGLKT